MSVSTGGNVIAPRSTASMIRTFASAGARGRARMSGSFPEAARTASTTSSSGSSSDEGVLHDGAEIVLDEDDGGEGSAPGQGDGDEDVIRITEHVGDLDGLRCRGRVRQAGEPAR